MKAYRDRLVEALASNAVVALVGTGVSRATSKNAQEADWIGLIRSGIERVREITPENADRWASAQTQSLDLAVDESDVSLLIGVAGQVASRLRQNGSQAYLDWLRDTVGELKVRDGRLAKAIGDLRTPILTTNYDHLLEEALRRPTATWRDRETMREIFRTKSEAIGHLHGSWKATDSVVLAPEDYAKILSHDATQLLESAHYLSKSFLFIGYGDGLNDPNFTHLLQWHRQLFPESRGDHFRLSTDGDYEELVRFHANDDIRVISYGPDHESLPDFLNGLVPSISRSGAKGGLGRDAVAYAREAIVDQIRSETVIGDSVDNIDDRGLADLTVNPVLLPMPHEQFVNARAMDDGPLRPERIDSSQVYLEDKILILAGEELSGVSTALRWIVANAALNRNRTAPIFVDARNCVITAKPLERQIRTEAYRHGLINGKKDPLPNYSLALDNLKPQTSREYKYVIDEIAASKASFIVIGCREGEEGQLLEDLKGVERNIEVAYLGKLGRPEVQAFARILAPNRPVTICDAVLKVVRSERLPRTPFTVALLVILLSQESASDTINNSETAVLDQYVNLLLGRSGPYLDPRHYLDPQNREVVLSQLAREFVQRRKGAMSQAEAVEFISKYFESRDWDENATATLENFRKMRLLRVEGNIVQFQQTSYLHLFAAKAATKDDTFLGELLADPLYFSPIIRHYAALVRDSERVVVRMKEILELWQPTPQSGKFYGPVRVQEVADADAEPSGSDEAEPLKVTDAPEAVDESDESEIDDSSEVFDDDYDESSDADRVAFPLDNPETWPEAIRLSAGLELSSRVLRDSDDLANLDVKTDVFRLVISRWGYLAQVFETQNVFEEVATEIAGVFVREKIIEPEYEERFKERFGLALTGFSLYRGLISTLASRKLVRTYERVRVETAAQQDPYSAVMLALFAFNIRGAGWTDELKTLAHNHGDRWFTVEFIRMLANMAWQTERLSDSDAAGLREFIKLGYSQKYAFPNERTKRIKLKEFDQALLRAKRKESRQINKSTK